MKTPAASEDCIQPLVFQSSSSRPSASLLRFGGLALVLAAVLLLCAFVAALFFGKVTDTNVYNVHYSMNINSQLREASAEIDSDNNLERFKTGERAEALEIHDFQSGITGIRFSGGDKCYIKSQIKDDLPDIESDNRERLMPDPRDEMLPVSSEEHIMTWVTADQPLKDSTFLSPKIITLCQGLPIYWLQPADPKGGLRDAVGYAEARAGRTCLGPSWTVTQYSAPLVALLTDGVRQRRRREAGRARQQTNTRRSKPAAAERRGPKEGAPRAGAEQEDNGAQSAGSAFNPENPYHTPSGGSEDSAMSFDPMLDHRGICCAECQRGYTQCQRVCEPLYGHWPWPYHHRGCTVGCRVIMPCRWWVARILGLV
uniref:Leukocyte cell-derived chemotaxin 1 n=1 Tax=Knipowitschia caucasica TaxID=637954 RepID=A0AAV2K3H5_KNICA